MSKVRVSRPYKVYRDNVFYREFSGRNELAEYMIDNHFPNLGLNYMYTHIISDHPHNGSKSYHGFTFEADPTWVGSKRTRAFNEDTGDVIITDSIGGMGRIFFGNGSNNGASRIRRFIKTGEKFRGYKFEDISEGYIDCRNSCEKTPSPVIGTNLRTGEIILCLTLTDAGRYVINTQSLSSTYIQTVRSKIKNSVEGYMGKSNVCYGYRWSYPE